MLEYVITFGKRGWEGQRLKILSATFFKTSWTWSLFIKGILAGFVVCIKYSDKCSLKILRVGESLVIVIQELRRVGTYLS